MKKFITLFLVLTMFAMIMASCGDGGKSDDNTTAPSTQADVTTAKPDDTKAPDDTTETPDDTTKAPDTTKEPEVTTEPEPTIEVPVIAEGLMVYYEDFESYANSEGNDLTMDQLKWTILNKADGAYTDNTCTYSIIDGALYCDNSSDSYALILEDSYMKPAALGDYTLQYDVKYISSSNTSRYIVVLLNYDGNTTYNSFHLRMRGDANNQLRFAGSWYTYDVAGDYYAPGKDDGVSSSPWFKMTGQTYADGNNLADKWITIRYQASWSEGPTVWLRDNSQANAEFVCVSKPDAAGTAAMFIGDPELITSYAVALKPGGTITGYVDNIAIWTGLGDMPTDLSTSAYEAAIADYLQLVG